MITDRYSTDEEFEKKEFKKNFVLQIILLPLAVLMLWGISYIFYTAYEIKPFYFFIFTYSKYIISIFFILIKIIDILKNSFYSRFNLSSVTSAFILGFSFTLCLLSAIFHYRGEDRDLIIDTVFITSFLVFLLYTIIYCFRYLKRANIGRKQYIKELRNRNYIIDHQYQELDDNYFTIKNKKLEEKLDILAIFIKFLTPALTAITVFVGYKYIQEGVTDPSIFIVVLVGIIGSAYTGSFFALAIVKYFNLNQIEKQIGRKIYNGLYPETIARKKAEAKEKEEYWEKKLEEEENKKSKKENS